METEERRGRNAHAASRSSRLLQRLRLRAGEASRLRSVIAFLLLGAATSCESAVGAAEQDAITILAAGANITPCSPPEPKSGYSGGDLDLSWVKQYPCELIAVYTGVTLRPSDDYQHPDPPTASPVVRDSYGRLYTVQPRGPIVVWDSLRRYLGTVGEGGDGPGEIATRPLALFIDRGDSLHVVELRRWSVFDPAHRFVRSFRTSGGSQSVHITSDHRAVFTRPVDDGSETARLHVADLNGGAAAPLGVGPPPSSSVYAPAGYPSALAPDGTVWIAPIPGSGVGYVLERWDLSGTLVQRMKREMPWLPLSGYPDEPMGPKFEPLATDADGLLYIGMVVKDPRWTSGTQSFSSERADYRFEVIDPMRGVVMASVRYDMVDERSAPPVLPISNWPRHTFRIEVDSLGRSVLSIYRLELGGR